MRSAEVVVGTLLLVSGTALPGLPVLEDEAGTTASVEGQAVFETADYAGPAEIEADGGALWSEGSLEATIVAESVTVTRYVWEGAHVDTWTGQQDGLWASTHHGKGTTERSATTYENATIRIDTTSEAVMSAWPNATRGPTTFAADLAADETPPIVASPSGTILWLLYSGFDHHVEGPLFALGHNGGRIHDAWVEDAEIEQLGIQGALDLNVLGGNVTVETDDGTDTYRTGVEQTETETDVHENTVRTKRVHALVHVTDAAFRTSMGEAESVFLAQEPTWTINGSLRMDAREGEVRTGAEDATLDDDTLTVLGNTTLDLAAQGETPDPSDPQPYPREERPTRPIEAEMTSDADQVSVDGQALQVPSDPVVPEEVTLWGKILGLLLVAFSVLKKLPAGVVGLLARDPLSNERRRRVHEHILEEGMVHVRGLARELDIPVSSAMYHLRVLREAGLLVRVEREGYTVYFSCDEFDVDEKERLALLAGGTRRDIACMLARRGAATQEALAELMDVSQSTVSKQVAKLEEAGLVESNGDHGIRYRASELLREWLARRGPDADAGSGTGDATG
jgi:predicted transcriptional regulator